MNSRGYESGSGGRRSSGRSATAPRAARRRTLPVVCATMVRRRISPDDTGLGRRQTVRIVFANGNAYFRASNPANNPNNQQAIVKATLSGTTVNVTPVINGNDTAVDRVGGAPVTLNLQDPDSMTVDPAGDLVLDSQADNELVFVLNLGSPSQSLQLLPLFTIDGNGNNVPVSIDDTVFVTSASGTMVITDQKGDAIFLLQATNFTVGSAFSAATGALLQLSTASGRLEPVVTAPVQPKGLAFIPM